MTALITTTNLAITHGKTRVLHGVTFQIARGEIVTIVGPNGSGKSSFLKALIGSIPLSAGTLTRAKGLKIGYVPQSLALDPTLPMTVRRFLDLPKRIDPDIAAKALLQAGCADLGAAQLSDLSGGQLQRVMLARALLSSPDLLILDEATQGLDQPGAASFYQRTRDPQAGPCQGTPYRLVVLLEACRKFDRLQSTRTAFRLGYRGPSCRRWRPPELSANGLRSSQPLTPSFCDG